MCFRVGGRKVVGSSVTTAESANGASRAFNNPAYIWRTSNREVVAVGAERLPRALDARASAARTCTNEWSERARARTCTCTCTLPRVCIYATGVAHGGRLAQERDDSLASCQIGVNEIHASYIAFLGSTFAFVFPETGRRLVAAAH